MIFTHSHDEHPSRSVCSRAALWRRPARTLLAAAHMMGALALGTAAYAQGASGPEWDAIVEAAKKEGAVTVYANYDPNQIPNIKAAFEKAYPEIKLEVLRLAAAAAQQRLDAEQKSGTMIADAIGSSDSAYQKANIPRFTKLVGPAIHAPDAKKWLFADDTFVMTYFVYYGYAWNTQVVPGTPTLKELLENPAYKGRVGLIDFSRGTTFAVTLNQLAKSYVQQFGGTEDEYYAKLKALEPRYYTTVVPIGQAIGSGELAFSPSIAPGFIDPKMPIGIGQIQSPPAGANYVAVTNGAPHPNAAQVFANWSLTVEGQTVLAANQASVLPNIPTAKVSASELVYTDTSALTTAEMDALVARQRAALGH